MDYRSDFRQTAAMSFKTHEDVFEYVEALRQITAVGEEMVSTDHAELRRKYAKYIAKKFDLYAGSGLPYSNRGISNRHLLGNIGPVIEGGPWKIAGEIVRPLEAISENLKEARSAAAKFPTVFYKWLEPVIHPQPSRASGDDFDDRFPGRP